MMAKRRVDGVLLLDKPTGLSSNAALQKAKRLLDAEKAGHTGTLDPMASGLLPLCFGEATKFARYLLDADKGYRATVRFGATTTTQDAEGDVVETRPVSLGAAQIEAALADFVGTILQVPPAHAALKYQGRAYYDYARKGIDIPRPARSVEIRSIALIDWQQPVATLDVTCGKGTYIRALAADLGKVLGCGAHLAALRRMATGGFVVVDALTLDALGALDEASRDASLRSVDCLLEALPRLDLTSNDASHVRHGRTIVTNAASSNRFRAYDAAGALLGVLTHANGTLIPERLVRDPGQTHGTDRARVQ